MIFLSNVNDRIIEYTRKSGFSHTNNNIIKYKSKLLNVDNQDSRILIKVFEYE